MSALQLVVSKRMVEGYRIENDPAYTSYYDPPEIQKNQTDGSSKALLFMLIIVAGSAAILLLIQRR